MRLTPKGLIILAFIAFLFSPFISPIPGILLFISAGFCWLSQAAQSTENDKVGEEVKENETIINDLGDKIVIIEKKTLYKKDMTYKEFREYGLKNVNCVGDCVSFEAPKAKNHYDMGHKKCSICNKWLITKELNCPCCSSLLRSKEKVKREDEPLF